MAPVVISPVPPSYSPIGSPVSPPSVPLPPPLPFITPSAIYCARIEGIFGDHNFDGDSKITYSTVLLDRSQSVTTQCIYIQYKH